MNEFYLIFTYKYSPKRRLNYILKKRILKARIKMIDIGSRLSERCIWVSKDFDYDWKLVLGGNNNIILFDTKSNVSQQYSLLGLGIEIKSCISLVFYKNLVVAFSPREAKVYRDYFMVYKTNSTLLTNTTRMMISRGRIVFKDSRQNLTWLDLDSLLQSQNSNETKISESKCEGFTVHPITGTTYSIQSSGPNQNRKYEVIEEIKTAFTLDTINKFIPCALTTVKSSILIMYRSTRYQKDIIRVMIQLRSRHGTIQHTIYHPLTPPDLNVINGFSFSSASLQLCLFTTGASTISFYIVYCRKITIVKIHELIISAKSLFETCSISRNKFSLCWATEDHVCTIPLKF
jgi:hypothetical protein